MALGTIRIRIWLKHVWLLKAINIPLLILGLSPCVPNFCIGTEVVTNAKL